MELDIRLEAGCRPARAATTSHRKPKLRVSCGRDPPGVVDVGRPFAVAEIGLGQRYGDNSVVGIAQQEVRARIAARSPADGRDLVGVLAVEIELAAREFVADLRKLVVPVLSAEAQRVLSR